MSGLSVSKIKDGLMGKLGELADLPDKPKKAWQRKALYILFDVGVILLGVMALGMATKFGIFTGHFAALSHPGFSTLMMLPAVGGAVGVGLSWLIVDIMGRRAARAAKVLSVATPILLLLGSFLLMASGGVSHTAHGIHFSLMKAMTSTYFYVGLLLVPLTLAATAKGLDVWSDSTLPFSTSIERRRGERRRELAAIVRNQNDEEREHEEAIEMETIHRSLENQNEETQVN